MYCSAGALLRLWFVASIESLRLPLSAMKRAFFKNIECYADASELELDEVLDQLAFDVRGLLPVITQDADTNDVLMLAWMNRTALTETLISGHVTYWSRSRNQLWVKGETSGHTQELVSLSIDCDGDAILCKVKQQGPACHTGRRHCFYLRVHREHRKIYVSEK